MSLVNLPKNATRWRLALDLCAPAFIMLAPLLTFLKYNRYDLLLAEASLIFLGMALGGVICGFFIHLGGRFFRALVYATLLTFFFDIQFETLPLIDKRAFATAFVATVFIISFAVSFLMSEKFSILIAAGFGTILLTTVLFPVTGQPEPRVGYTPPQAGAENDSRNLPLFLHLVLDEHIGIEGLPAETPEARALKERLKAFYPRNGFRLYGGAHSQHFDTSGSLFHAFNFSEGYNPSLGSNGTLAYLQEIQRHGYRINIYGTHYLNLCEDENVNHSSCYFYSATSVGDIRFTTLPVQDKFLVLFKSFFYRSLIYQKLCHELDRLRNASTPMSKIIPRWDWERNTRIQPITAMTALGHLRRDLMQASPGDMFLAHLILPHFPYIYTSDCRFAETRNWLNRIPLSGKNTGKTRDDRYRKYVQQIDCTLIQLEKTFDILRQKKLFDDAVIIIHGDHGSRIGVGEPPYDPRNPMSSADFKDGFSTLFAVKLPESAPGYEEAPISLSRLFADLAKADFKGLPTPSFGDQPQTVFMTNKETHRVEPVRGRFFGAGSQSEPIVEPVGSSGAAGYN